MMKPCSDLGKEITACTDKTAMKSMCVALPSGAGAEESASDGTRTSNGCQNRSAQPRLTTSRGTSSPTYSASQSVTVEGGAVCHGNHVPRELECSSKRQYSEVRDGLLYAHPPQCRCSQRDSVSARLLLLYTREDKVACARVECFYQGYGRVVTLGDPLVRSDRTS